MKKFFFYFFYIIIIFISIFLVDFFLTKILNNYEKKFFIKHPVYHHTFAKNKIFYSKGTKYFTDSLGFRNKKNLKLKQKSEKKRLLIIGDSFTEGIGLDYDKTFVGIISNILNKENIKHQVLNAKNHENEAEIIANAGTKKSVIITTSISGRGVDIQLGGKKDQYQTMN